MTSDDYKDSIGKHLRKYRLEREWSIAHVSRLARISVGALWNIEHGKRPSDINMVRLRKAIPELFRDIAA